LTKSMRLESQGEGQIATDAFSMIGLQNFYKLDKLQYTRADVAEIGVKLSKKLDVYE